MNVSLTNKLEGLVNQLVEKQLFKAADKLQKNIDAAEYKHVVLGLIFLKYISEAFEVYREKQKACDPKNFIPDEGIQRIADTLIGLKEVEKFSFRAGA